MKRHQVLILVGLFLLSIGLGGVTGVGPLDEPAVYGAGVSMGVAQVLLWVWS